MKAILVSLMLWVTANSPLPLPETIPVVRLQDPTIMACRLEDVVPCDESKLEPDNVWYGYYMNRTQAPPHGAIVVSSAIGTEGLVGRSVLLHEVIHHMQVSAGQQYDIECQAYALEDAWLRERGSSLEEAFLMDKMNYIVKTTCYEH